jgi:hypothetical protein
VTSWHLARLRMRCAYEAMPDQVKVTVAGQPLPRLQAAGPPRTCPPYWTNSAGASRNHSRPLRRCGSCGHAIELLPGAGNELPRLGPPIRPESRWNWTRRIAEINGAASGELDLHRHLFGSDRSLPPPPGCQTASRPCKTAAAATGRSAAPRKPATSSRGFSAASTPWRTWSWRTCGATRQARPAPRPTAPLRQRRADRERSRGPRSRGAI